MITMRPTMVAGLVALTALVGGCSEEEQEADAPVEREDAIEAREENTFEMNGMTYRVAMFRQINPKLESDGVLYEGRPPKGKTGVFAAFLRVCNTSDERKTPTGNVTLEDAFGEKYPRLKAASDAYEFEPESLRPDVCLPGSRAGGAGDFPGAAVLFAVPFDKLGNRPFVLQFKDRGDAGKAETRRIELDL